MISLDGAEKVNEYLKKEGYSETSYQSTLHPSSSAKISLGGRNMTSVKDCDFFWSGSTGENA